MKTMMVVIMMPWRWRWHWMEIMPCPDTHPHAWLCHDSNACPVHMPHAVAVLDICDASTEEQH